MRWLLAWVVLASTLALYQMVKPTPAQVETLKAIEQQQQPPQPAMSRWLLNFREQRLRVEGLYYAT